MNKKGQIIDNLQKLVLMLVPIAILIVVGFLIMAQGKTQAIGMANTGIVTNQSVTWSNNSYTAINPGLGSPIMELSCSVVMNDTNGIVIPSSNYTCDQRGINLTDYDQVGQGWSAQVNVTYTYKNMSAAYNATSTSQEAMSEIPGWFAIIVITIIGALLIGLVANFRRR
jgi:hypothetical protein